MGASGWSYVAPYRGNVAEALRELRERVFRDREYYWWDDFEEDEPRPATIDGIWQSEPMKESGTHSVLDVYRVVATTAPASWGNSDADFGTIRPLAPDQVRRYFGSDRPARAQFEALSDDYAAPGHREFIDEVTMRWTGRYVLLYDGDQPTEVGIWGASGD